MRIVIKNTSLGAVAVLLLVFLFSGCKETLISDDPAGFDPEGDLSVLNLMLRNPGQASGERLADLGNGKLFNLTDAGNTPEKIDFIMLWSATSGMNLLSPGDADNLNAWAVGKTLSNTWLVKNTTTFVKLSPSEQSARLYENIKKADDLKAVYDQAVLEAPLQANYTLREHGPALSVQNLAVGDVLFVKSSKNVYAAAQVTALTTGISGSVQLIIKLDKRNQADIPKVDPSERIDYYELVIDRPGDAEGKRYVDLSAGVAYSTGAATLPAEHAAQNQEKIDLIFYTHTGRNGFNFISPDNETRLALWPAGAEVNQSWQVKNKGQYVKIAASAYADALFLNTFKKSDLQASYDQAAAYALTQPGYNVDVHGPGKHVSDLKKGDVIVFTSESKNITAMAQVSALSTGESGSVSLTVKVDNSEKVFVSPPTVRTLVLAGVGASSADFIDFSVPQVRTIDAAELDPAKIDVSHMRGTGTGHNLISITNGSGFGAFTAALRTRIEAWPVRNETQMVNLGSAQEYVALYDSLNEGNRAAMQGAFDQAKALYTPIARLTALKTGDILFLNSVDRGIIVAIKVTEANNSGSLTIAFKVSKN